MDAKITVVGQRKSIFNHFISELRDHEIQQDRLRFRKNLFRCSQILAYELSKFIEYEVKEIETTLGSLEIDVIKEQPVLVSILRAGVPMHNGFLDYYDHADNGFVSAFRKHAGGGKFTVQIEYLAMPSVENETLVLLDPMIASGKTVVLTNQAIIPAQGHPKKIFIVCIIASEEGLEYVRRHCPSAHIIVGAIDDELTAKSYIVPGLGDAGDLAFGSKTSG